ncbi:unnamed protein product [Mortierella alpina]
MSGSTRIASRILTGVRHQITAQSRPACSATAPRHRLPASTRFITTTSHHSQKQAGEPIEKPATTIEPPKINLDAPIFNPQDSVKSIEQVIAELNQDTRTAQSASSTSSLSSSSLSAQGSESSTEGGPSSPYADANTGSEQAGAPPPPPPTGPKKPSRFWFYLYYVLFYSALGSLPVHVLLTKNEAKDTKERQEWKIAVLTDMRDKLQRGESIEEEEALLSVGMDRSAREEQVDDKYFEDLLQTAEKLDFQFSKDKDTTTTSEPNATTAPAPVPSPPVVPRKPAPPKTEKSYL